MHGAVSVGVGVYSAMQFAGADVMIVSGMIKGNANIKKHIYAYIYITYMVHGIKRFPNTLAWEFYMTRRIMGLKG